MLDNENSNGDLLNIIVPVYNEAENFPHLYAEIKRYIRHPHEILVVYDFDEDNTLPVVKRLQAEDRSLRLVKNSYGKGVANALRCGFHAVAGGPCLVLMADLSDELGVVDKMLEKHREGFKIVCGSRYMPGGRQIGGPLLKRTLSRLAGLSFHWLTGIPTRDVTNNFKLYNKSIFDQIKIESQGGFEVAMEITVKAFLRGYKICEIPSTWRDRVHGTSRFRVFHWLPHYLRWYWIGLIGRVQR